MAKLREIETKWDANKVDRNLFNKSLRTYIAKKKISSSFLRVGGFDYYYESKGGYVVRHRHGKAANELTVKARLSNKSIKVRHETNLHLSQTTPFTEVATTLELLGFSLCFAIYKDCDIYFIKDGEAEISIVWYKVPPPKPKMKTRFFCEVEVQNVPTSKSLTLLNKWSTICNELFGVSKKDIVPESLYEIYSGKRYKLVK